MWARVQADFWQPETAPMLSMAVVLTLALCWLRRAEWRTWRNTFLFFGMGLAVQCLGVALKAMALRTGAMVLDTVGFVLSAIALIRLLGFVVFRLLLPRVGLHPPRIHEDLAMAGSYVLLGLVQIRLAGVDLSGILATSAVITAVLAFAMQDTLGNMLGGLALQLDHSIKIGDWIRVDDVMGQVMQIQWRSTAIETPAWETVVIPNSMLMKSKFVILGRREGQPLQWRRTVVFAVDPGTPPGRVILTAEAALKERPIPRVAREPAPQCLVADFRDGNLTYHLRYWTNDPGAMDPADSDVRLHVFSAFQRNGIRVAEPQSKAHLIKQDQAHAENVQKREVHRRLTLLACVDLFSSLSEEERLAVAERLQYQLYARGDQVTRQGATSHWLYIVVSGEAEVVLEGNNGERTYINRLTTGEFFGEMALMTGEPRSASVYAATDLACYRLDHASFHDLLLSRPELAEEISKVMATRRAGLSQAANAGTDTSSEPNERELLRRIRKFFGLEGRR
jgi:small-conductance mechanosensitive channel